MAFHSIPPLVMASIVFYVGAYHFFLYFRRQRTHPEDLSFALLCLTMALYDGLCVGAYNVHSLEEGFWWQRLQVGTLSLTGAMYLWFGTDYVQSKSKRIRNIGMAFFLVSGVLVMVSRHPLFWHPDQPSVKMVVLPWKYTIRYYEVVPGIYADFLGIMGLLVYVYIFWISYKQFRNKKDKFIPIFLSTGIYCAGLVNDAMFHMGLIHSVYLIEYAYMAIVILMASTLSNTVVESALMKEALEVSELKYRNLMENSLAGVLIVQNQKIQYCNRQFLQIFGYTKASEVMGASIHRFLYPPLFESEPSSSEDRIPRTARIECKGIRKDGKVLDLDLMYSEIQYEEKPAFQVTLIDITDRRQAEEALKRERDLAQKYLNVAGVMLMALSPDGTIQMMNRKGCQILGREEREILGENWFEEFIPRAWRSKVRKQFSFLFSKSGPPVEYFENPVVISSGEERLLAFYVTLLTNSMGQVIGWLCSGEDITERKQMENRMKKELEEKQILLKEVHHRVKNNLQIIISLLNLELYQLKDPALMSVLEITIQRIRSMAMIHERLYHADVFTRIDFKEYVESLLAELFLLYEVGHRVRYELDIENVYLDIETAIPCGLILNELITNAIKHAFPQGTKGQIRISFKSLPESYYELVVQDNGIGIPETAFSSEGTSLGLKLVEVLTQQLGGSYEIQRNKGSTILIRFQKAESTNSWEEIEDAL